MNVSSISDGELLQFALDNGMIDPALVRKKIEMQKREELLKKHPYAIWKGQNGSWYTYLPDENKGRLLKKKKSREEIEDVVIAYWKEELENPTIREVFAEWNDRRLELGKISASTHLRNEQVFRRHYAKFGERRIKGVTETDLGDFLERQIPEHGLTARAFSNLKSITKGFIKRAKKRGLTSINLEGMLQELDVSESDFNRIVKEDYEEVFSEDEMPAVMDYLTKNPDAQNLGILLMFLTGARIGEVVALRPGDFDGNTFRIRRTETRYRNDKGVYVCDVKEFPKSQAGVRTAIIPEDFAWVAAAIRRMSFGQDYAFQSDGRRLTAQSLRMRLKRVCRKLGVYHKSPHKIRKTYGSILLDNHVDNRLVIGQMGHTEILCTERHYHRNRRSVEQKSRIISSLPEFKAN